MSPEGSTTAVQRSAPRKASAGFAPSPRPKRRAGAGHGGDRLWRTAKLCIEQYGEDAATHAAMRADELMEAGDMDGRAVWRRLLEAVKVLLAQEPEGTVH